MAKYIFTKDFKAIGRGIKNATTPKNPAINGVEDERSTVPSTKFKRLFKTGEIVDTELFLNEKTGKKDLLVYREAGFSYDIVYPIAEAVIPYVEPTAQTTGSASPPVATTVFTTKNITIGAIVLAAMFVAFKYKTIIKMFK